MAETVSGRDDPSRSSTFKQPAKRRRILDPSAVVTVPIYSNKVNSCLKLHPLIPFDTAGSAVGEPASELDLWPELQSPPKKKDSAACIVLSDSEEETEADGQLESFRSPSPPSPPQSPAVKVTSRASRKIREINSKLNVLGSLLSPGDLDKESSDCLDDGDDDIILVSGMPLSEKSREISLKFRYRTNVYKIPVQSMTPLSMAVNQLSVKLCVPAQCILLLRNDMELPVESTASELGLGIADIIDCVVLSDMDKKNSDVITVRLQGKDKGSSQAYSIHKEAPLGSIISQYLSQMPTGSRKNIRFLFDGLEVMQSQTPSQLEMEDGDIVEVWA